MKDRLIELLDNAVIGRGTYLADGTLVDVCGEKAIDKITAIALADYLLANGVIVPPCKVGDIVYAIFEGKIETLKVVHAIIEESAEGVSKYYDAENKFLKMPFAECHIGKSIFLTPEAAEQALEGGAE